MSCDYFSAVNEGVALSEIAGPFSAADVAANCSSGPLKEPLLWVVSYTLMAVCALVLIALLLLLVLPCRRRDRSGEITDESSLVRHRIKWLRGTGRAERVNKQVDSELNPSPAVENGVRLSLHRTLTPGSECPTDSRLHSEGCPMETDKDGMTASWQEHHPNSTSYKQLLVMHLWFMSCLVVYLPYSLSYLVTWGHFDTEGHPAPKNRCKFLPGS